MSLSLSSTLPLNTGAEIPRLGLGVYQSQPGSVTRAAVTHALQCGYRHIDTASAYGNEESVREAIQASGLPAESVFVTTKLWNSDQGATTAVAAFEQSFLALGEHPVDLYLIHWPVPKLRLESWKALETRVMGQRCRAIGVSNFLVPHLQELLDRAQVVPAVNQIELHPYNYRTRIDTVELCREHGIVVEAYSPLTRAQRLGDPRLVEVAKRYGATPAQILIRWSLQHDFVVIPKSTNPQRIQENADVFRFEISDEDMHALDGLDEGLSTCWDPTGIE